MSLSFRSANRELISSKPSFGLMYGSTFLIFIFAICSWVIFEGQFSGIFPEKKYVLIGQSFILLLFAVVHYNEIAAMLLMLKSIKEYGLEYHERFISLHGGSDFAGLVYLAPPMVAIRQNYNFHSWAYRANILLSNPIDQVGDFSISSNKGSLHPPFENYSFIGFDRYRLLERLSAYEDCPHILIRLMNNETVYLFNSNAESSSGSEKNSRPDNLIVCRLKDLKRFILLTFFRIAVILFGVFIILAQI